MPRKPHSHGVTAKKHLGQHFLNDTNIACQTAQALQGCADVATVIEVGPGTGVLTQYLLNIFGDKVHAYEIDEQSVGYLQKNYPQLTSHLYHADFLQSNISHLNAPMAIVGNFPYNISSQIFFKILDMVPQVPLCVGMLQKEVAQRLAAGPGSKTYGILSVLLQVWYNVELLFEVPPHVFTPPPKVNSAVIRLTRNQRTELACKPALFKQIVKQSFNNRRKTLRNSLKMLNLPEDVRMMPVLSKRPEQLSVAGFEELACLLQPHIK